MKELPLTKGFVTIVDDEDYGAVSARKWHACVRSNSVYAATAVRKENGKQTLLYLHRFLLPGTVQVDHRDGNGLNNSRQNLRDADSSRNHQGFQTRSTELTSRFRGVCRAGSRWQAQIRVSGVRKYLGRFLSEKQAAIQYNKAAKEFFGDFASLNIL